MCVLELVDTFEYNLKQVFAKTKHLRKRVSDVDAVINDLYHILESQKLDAVALVKMSTNLQKLVKKRRELKTDLNLLISLENKLKVFNQGSIEKVRVSKEERIKRDEGYIVQAKAAYMTFDDKVNKVLGG